MEGKTDRLMTTPFVIDPINLVILDNVPGKPWRGRRVEVPWPLHRFPLVIDIYVRTESDRDWRADSDAIIEYEVNWSALGSQVPEFASYYAGAIILAATQAKVLTERYKGKSRDTGL